MLKYIKELEITLTIRVAPGEYLVSNEEDGDGPLCKDICQRLEKHPGIIEATINSIDLEIDDQENEEEEKEEV